MNLGFTTQPMSAGGREGARLPGTGRPGPHGASWNWALAAGGLRPQSQEDRLQHVFDPQLTSSLLPPPQRCSSPWFTWPHSPCVKRRPLPSCVTMAPACARLASQEMTPPEPFSLPSWAALATRCVLVRTQGFEALGGSTALWGLC